MDLVTKRTPLAERLRLERAARDWTQARLAKEAGISPSTLALIEGGQESVRARTVYRLAQALGIAPVELMRLAETTEQEG